MSIGLWTQPHRGFAGNDTLRGGTPPVTRTSTTIIGFVGDDTLDGGIGSGPDARRARRRSAALARCRRRSGGRRHDLRARQRPSRHDLADDDPRALPASCETIDQGAINEGANVRIAPSRLRVSRTGTVRVRLRCPASVEIGCRGRLAAGAPRRALGRRTRYRIRRGATARVTVRVPRALRRAAARRDRAPARVVSIETGSHGPKLTIRPMLLR